MLSEKKKRTRWEKVRKLVNDIHLWLGLSSGLIVIAVCLSGTIYVFQKELTENAAPHLFRVSVPEGTTRLSADSILKMVKVQMGGTVSGMMIPSGSGATFQVTVRHKEANTTYYVNPYSGAITGNSKEKNSTKEFMSAMFSLHRWLLLDRIEKPIISGMTNRKLGSAITGWATIIFTLGCISGLVLWFPKKIKHWRQGLKIKWSGKWKRLNHDLHNTLAFYSLFILLMMGLTGPQWSFDWYRTGLQKTLGIYKGKEAAKKPGIIAEDSLSSTAQVEQFIETADASLPWHGDYQISFPSEAGAPVLISKYRLGFFAPAAPDRITVDRFSAEIIKKDIFRDKPVNQRIAGSIKAIHVGNVYGMFTKVLYFLACLIATSLPITGTMIWLNKRKKVLAVKTGQAT